MTRLNNKWFRCILLFVVMVAVVRPCPAVDFSPVYTSINGRDFGYYVPESYDPSTPTPLLFMFHGMGGNNSEASGGSAENGYYGWQTTAHENGFIVLFPKKENLWGLNLWSLASNGNSSDLPFVDDMIGWATTNYNISESQIFTTGHSYGAYFSYYVARWRSDDIAAFGEHSGGLNNMSVPTGPSPTPRLNGILLHAVDDGLVKYSGSQNLYDALTDNGHNTYPGIIQVDGWGPDNHRYRKVHNQTQWDFFLSVTLLPGDATGDGCVNEIDLTAVATHWQQSTDLWEHGDFNGDGIVNDLDLTVLAVNWQEGCGGGGSFEDAWAAAQANVPEPVTLSLLAIGGLSMIRRRRR